MKLSLDCEEFKILKKKKKKKTPFSQLIAHGFSTNLYSTFLLTNLCSMSQQAQGVEYLLGSCH